MFYGLDQIPGTTKNTVLTDLQIVQPIMRDELRRLRNMVAHEYGAALPDVRRCREFAEFTFYFLRSTDKLLDSPVGVLSFDGPEDAGSFMMNIKPGTWTMSIEGELYRGLVSENLMTRTLKSPSGGQTYTRTKFTSNTMALVEMPHSAR